MIICTQFLKFVLEIQNIFQNPTTQRQYRFDHTCAWKFFSEGEWSKNLLRGMWGGIQMFKVLSVREIFSCFFPNF